jgi:hypothetical protein
MRPPSCLHVGSTDEEISLHTTTAQRTAAIAALSCAAAFAAAAQPRHAPPQEAYDACAGKKQSDQCSVELREDTIQGACTPDDQSRLFCRPDRPPPGAGGGKPRMVPPEAFSACEGKKNADECSVELRDRTIEGACAADDQNRLFCRPARPPPPAQGN